MDTNIITTFATAVATAISNTLTAGRHNYMDHKKLPQVRTLHA